MRLWVFHVAILAVHHASSPWLRHVLERTCANTSCLVWADIRSKHTNVVSLNIWTGSCYTTIQHVRRYHVISSNLWVETC
jgi:hypothetical protein